MAPEVLIVGDAMRRADLLQRVARLGYETSVCTRAALEQRVTRGQVPGAVLVCTEDEDPRTLMAELRGTRRGLGVPVTLYGPLGGTIGDLADVLDLGADHFLEAPAADDALAAALEELVGPGGSSPGSRPTSPSTSRSAAPGERTGTGSAAVSATRGGDDGSTDVVLGQLHRTLDMLEARLREREEEGEVDDLDLDALGLPPVHDEREHTGSRRDAGRSNGRAGGTGAPRDSSLELPLAHTQVAAPVVLATRPATTASAARGRREPTERLGQEESRGASTGSPARASAEDRPRRRAPLPLEDHGTLDRVEVPRLLWTLHRARYTGGLSLSRGRVDKRLSWRDGDIVFARSNVGHDRLIDGLLHRGLLTREQYATARELAAEAPDRVGPRLVEAGLLKPAELPRALREHLLRIIDSTFPWTDGRWVLTPGDAPVGAGLVDAPVPLVVAEGVRHRMESAQLTGLLGGLELHPRVRGEAAALGGPRELAERLRLSPSEEAWLPRLDGTASLRALLAQPGTDELELLALVYVLHVLDHLELFGLEPSGPGLAAAATADPVALDVARIRDRLALGREGDYFAMLGLPRDAARLEVRRAHADLRRTFADDRLEPSVCRDLRTELEELRDLLDEARDVLADDGLRNAYLAHLEEP